MTRPLVTGVMTAADFMTPTQLVDHAQRLEALGYEQLWITDIFGREIYLTAGFILAHTERIKVASGVAHIYGRDHIAAAQAGRTLSELYGGRFVQGLGVSHPVASQMRGVPWENPMDKARSYADGMRETPIIHTPRQWPPVPVYLAAHGPKMLAVAAESYDGANCYMQTPDGVREARAILGPDKVLNVLVPSCLTTDAAAGRRSGRQAVSIYLPLPAYQRVWARAGFDATDWSEPGSDRLVDTYMNWGDLATVTARLQGYLDAGASDIILAAGSPEAGNPARAFELVEALAPAAGVSRRP